MWTAAAPIAGAPIAAPLVPAAGTSLPTLSAPTYVPGSLTTTGFRPRVTYTF